MKSDGPGANETQFAEKFLRAYRAVRAIELADR